MPDVGTRPAHPVTFGPRGLDIPAGWKVYNTSGLPMEDMVLSLGSTRLANLLADTDWGHHMDGWAGGMALGWVLMALLVVLVAGVIWTSARPRVGSTAHRALDLLDERFVRGEIDRDEYLERKADLRR